jgi:CO/xanthine dehydrogenase Mo-binding subunit
LATSAYRLENVHIEGYDVVTNKAKTTAYRAPGMPQITFAVEQAVDALAREIEMDPIDFRLRNVSGEGYVQANDVSLPKVGFRQVLEASREHPHWMSPRPSGPNQGRGVAVGFWRNNQNTSTCEVHVNQDGTVGVVMGAIDISGTRTALQQIAAEELNVDGADVRVEIGDTQTAPFNATSAGSRITYSSSNALHLACQDVIEKLRSRAAKIFGVDSTEVEFTHREFRVPGGGDSISIRKLAYADEGVIVGIGSSQALPLHPTLSV